MNYKFLIILFILCFTSCSFGKLENSIPDDIIANRQNYNAIVETIYKSDWSRFSERQFISKDYFPKELEEVLGTTKLRNKVECLNIFKNSECEQTSIELKSGKYSLFYIPCPNDRFPLPDSYTELGHIGVWGIDKNWVLQKVFVY